MSIHNFVAILSVIDPPNTPLSYINTRSVFSKKERFDQTMLTINSIKKYIINPYICFIECSVLEEEYELPIKELVDKYINLYSNEEAKEIIFSPYKGFGESIQVIEAIKNIPKNISFSNFFKIAGRYVLNENFDYNKFENNKIVIKKIDSINNISTIFYKIPLQNLEEFMNFHKQSIHLFKAGYGSEIIFAYFINSKNEKDLQFMNPMGIEGYVSVCGSFVSC